MAELVKFFGIYGFAIVAIAWVVKSVISSSLSRDIERFKIELEAAHTNALERTKAELARQTLQHEVQFRRVDERVGRRLEQSFHRLQKLYESVFKLVKIIEFSGGPSKDELFEQCRIANAEFNSYYFRNRCYIPPTLDLHIKKVAGDLADIASGFARGMKHEADGRKLKGVKDYWWKAFQTADKEAQPMFSIMLKAIRKRLGVEDSPAELSILATVPSVVLPIEASERAATSEIRGVGMANPASVELTNGQEGRK